MVSIATGQLCYCRAKAAIGHAEMNELGPNDILCLDPAV